MKYEKIALLSATALILALAPTASVEARGRDGSRHRSVESKSNFGSIVAPRAKTWKSNPEPGYKNFGEWVSCHHKNCGAAPVPTAPVTPVPNPRPTAAPVPTSKPRPKPRTVPTSTPTSGPTSVPTSAPTATPTSNPVPVPTSTSTPLPVPTTTSTPLPIDGGFGT